jgi:pimeloyl-ACP methyl ester carboxylesterase
VDDPNIRSVEVDRASLTVATWGEGIPEIVLLHDGLGSIAQWRGVPAAIAERTGVTVLAYDRAGHGGSRPVPPGVWPTLWLHDEAEVLARLCAVLEIEAPTLVGHSDGGSIALIHAANGADVTGLVLLAAHTWLEERCADTITALRIDRGPVLASLSRYHAEPAALLEAWSGVWISEPFRSWDIRPLVGAINAPVLVVQGADDEYATLAHATETAAAIGPNAECRILPDRHHLLHHEDPDTVVHLVTRFVGDNVG